MTMEKVYEIINEEIKHFNGAYSNDNGTDKQKEFTKQFEGLDHINTSKMFAEKSWEFSKLIEQILEAVEEVAETFETIPDGAILKGTDEYKARRDSEEPKCVTVGFTDRLDFNTLASIARQGVGRRDLKKVWYF